MTLRGKTVLVTGATGFIGSRLVRRLAAEGCRVHALVRKTSRPDRLEGLWDELPRHVGDLGDAQSLAACLRACRPDVVFHLAKDRQGARFEREAAATLRLADALGREAPKARWVRTAHAVEEKFGRSADAELARAAAAKHKLAVVTLELFLVYGPGQGAKDFPRRLLEEAEAAGPLSALEGVARDFVHVDDVAGAYVAAAEKSGVEGKTFQIGSGVLTPEAEVAALLLKILEWKAAGPAAGKAVAGGHPADLGPARRELGWEPTTSLKQGLAQMVRRRV